MVRKWLQVYTRSDKVCPKEETEKFRGFVFSALALVVLFSSAFSQDFISQIGWRKAEPGVIITIFLVMASGIGFLSFVYVRTRVKLEKSAREASAYLFEQLIHNADLTRLEQQRLRTLLLYENIKDPQIIFQSISLYERCLDAYVQNFLSVSPSSESVEHEEQVLGNLRKKMGYNFLAYEHPMVSTRNLSIGQKVSIVSADNKSVLIQNATVVKNRELSFVLQYNAEKEEVVNLLPGTQVNIVFTRYNDGAYGVNVKVKKLESGTIELMHTLKLKRNQLRQHIRVEASMSLKFRLIKTMNQEFKPLRNKVLNGKTVDISGGGLSFLYEKSFTPGDMVLVTIPFPDGVLSGITLKILRVSLVEGKTSVQYRHHGQFVAIESKYRERIIHYAFEKQRQINQMR
ncbi:hypothetical protein CHISP_1381 [Chitinispirillum alkaliphilum]|nr:hypothetical protein CHISP_1381 [Chitinispirillum alkaliphilum]